MLTNELNQFIIDNTLIAIEVTSYGQAQIDIALTRKLDCRVT